jgi:peptidoglycan hydrolase CwlO-like protein
MKQMSTTPVSNTSLAVKASLVAAAILMAIAAPISTYSPKVHADEFDTRISQLQAQADQYQAKANDLKAQGDTLQNALDGINNEISGIQAQISVNQTKHDQLKQQIADNEDKLAKNKDALGDTIASMYVEGKVTPLEMLASSNTISDYVDKQEYQSSIRAQLSKTIDEVKKLKAQLEEDQKAVEKVLNELNAQNAQLAAKQQQQQQLVNQTRGDEAAYQGLVSQAQAQMAAVSAQQRDYYQSLIKRSGNGGTAGVVGSFQYSNWSGNQGCSGGYPYCGRQDSMVDPWGLYNRECVSYVAWSLANRFGKYVGNFSGQGNAYEWPSTAPAYSGATRVYSPQRGDAVILPASGGFAPIGHAMIVESVNGDTMHVSQYNFYGTGEYSTMDIKNSGVVLLRFPDR